MESGAGAMHEARQAYERRDWRGALHAFRKAADAVGLGARDWSARADAAWWVGEIDEAIQCWEVAYQQHLDTDEPGPAALVAMLISLHSYE